MQKFKTKLDLAFSKSDFENNPMFDEEYNIDFLIDTYNILGKYNNYEDDIFIECKNMIDIFCLQELYQIALRLSLEEDGNIDNRAGNYIYILSELNIDFNMMIAIAGKDFYTSDFFDENEEENDINIIKYLIDENYDKVVRLLKRNFKINQELLEFIIKDFNIYDNYEELKNNVSSISEFFDYPEIMKLYSWADGGFDISGES